MKMRTLLFPTLTILILSVAFNLACRPSNRWEGIWVEESSPRQPGALLHFNSDGSFYSSGLSCPYSSPEPDTYVLNCKGFKEICSVIANGGSTVTLECKSYSPDNPDGEDSQGLTLRKLSTEEAQRIRHSRDLQ